MTDIHELPYWGVHEVSEHYGVQKQVVCNWRKRKPDFPQPYVVLAMGPIWKPDQFKNYNPIRRSETID